MMGKKVHHGLLVLPPVAVGAVAPETGHVLPGASQQFVETSHLITRLPMSPSIEIVIVLSQDEHGQGCAGDQKIGHLQACPEHAGRVLLAVGREFVFQVVEKSGHKATWGGHGKALLDGP